jgi:hypothetical protein
MDSSWDDFTMSLFNLHAAEVNLLYEVLPFVTWEIVLWQPTFALEWLWH